MRFDDPWRVHATLNRLGSSTATLLRALKQATAVPTGLPPDEASQPIERDRRARGMPSDEASHVTPQEAQAPCAPPDLSTEEPARQQPAPPARTRWTGSAAGAELGRFVSATYANAQGERSYKLYLPPIARADGGDHRGASLIVMLHGCKQDPNDFAAGTRMNQLADGHGCYVLYPTQPASANRSRCWNWYKQGDQARGRGEPSIIAGMTRQVIATYPIDPARVYVAGMSAGGAMAATMAATYPDLYAAAGVHSGLPHAAAHDLMTALAVMREGPRGNAGAGGASNVPTIIFHGDADATVHPCNAEHVAQQVQPATAPEGLSRVADGARIRVERGRAVGGHAYTRTLHWDEDGRTQVEHWLIHGAAHAWSGGSPQGSFTDPRGPDASAEMLRFFGQHRHAASA